MRIVRNRRLSWFPLRGFCSGRGAELAQKTSQAAAVSHRATINEIKRVASSALILSVSTRAAIAMAPWRQHESFALTSNSVERQFWSGVHRAQLIRETAQVAVAAPAARR
jgi:hypothetical protein